MGQRATEYFLFSDSHLMDFTRSDQLRFTLLKDAVIKADVVIADGDIVEPSRSEQVWDSPWGDILSIMKNKTIFLNGNHDTEIKMRTVRPFWSHMDTQYRIRSGGVTIDIAHGHKVDTAAHWDEVLKWTIVDRWYQTIKFYEEQVTLPGKKNLVTWFYRSWNEEQKRLFFKRRYPHTRRVAAHTHQAAVDRKHLYMNLGSFNRFIPSWGSIKNGDVSLHIYGRAPQTIYRDQIMLPAAH